MLYADNRYSLRFIVTIRIQRLRRIAGLTLWARCFSRLTFLLAKSIWSIL